MDIDRTWANSILHLIAEDPNKFYSYIFPNTDIEPVGANLRLQPCPKCGHHDCCTVTPGEIAVNCFSSRCISGNHLKFVFEVLGCSEELLNVIGNFYNLPYNNVVSEVDVAEERFYKIRDVAARFYNKQLLEEDKAITYQLQTRRHSMETLRLYQVGFSKNYHELEEGLLSLEYTLEEIKNAKVWVPEGLFVYPYIDPYSKRINRFNTKNPFEVTYQGKITKGFSVGDKVMMTSPTLDKEYVILVEGENDLLTVYEHGGRSIIAIGGKISKEQLDNLKKALPRFSRIYCMFDTDEQGQEYEKEINEAFPQLMIYHVEYGEYKDPDERFVKQQVNTTVYELLERAVLLDTKGYNVSHTRNIWVAENRVEKLEFEILDKNNKTGSLTGTIKYSREGEVKDIEYDKSLAKCKFKPLNFCLIDAIDAFFNENLKDRTLDELISMYFYTKWKGEVIRLISDQLFATPDADKEALVTYLKKHLGEEITDIILKEVNERQNEEIEDISAIPRMMLGQFFSVKNKEAFMYFTYVKKDGDTIRKLPYLVTNDRQLLRLDLYRRKDEQCIILVRNKYELPIEVPQALMDLQRLSLSQAYVEQYISNEIDPRELDPKLLIRRLEVFLRKCYYFEEENLYKVLALWIYGTYCYELFNEYPYLFLNGPKGSGKSILDTCLSLLCFNPIMSISISDAALFRTVSIEGGTIILDEMESLTSRTKTADSALASVLKGGYQRAGVAIRCDKDNNNQPQNFVVFGPKVVSNIFGLEDIISDRCIQINTKEVKPEHRTKLEDPKQYFVDGLSNIRELTSKCALSVLEHFSEIYDVFREKVFHTESARLAQILRPLQALAYVAGPDYEKAFIEFYQTNVKVVREETEYETPEGALKDILIDVCHEIMGIKDPSYLSTAFHKYKEPIRKDSTEGWFELDIMHIKTFMEEVMGGQQPLDSRQINTWVRRVSTVNMNTDNRKRRTTIKIEDEHLIKELNGNTRQKVHVYRFYLTDFFSDEQIAHAMINKAANVTTTPFEEFMKD